VGQALEEISNHTLLGVGTGDVKQVLSKRYANDGFTGPTIQNLNVHNEYLETWMRGGIFSFILLVCFFVASVIYAFKLNDTFFVFVIFLIAMNLLTESMLNRQAGSVFIATLFSLWFVQKKMKKYSL